MRVRVSFSAQFPISQTFKVSMLQIPHKQRSVKKSIILQNMARYSKSALYFGSCCPWNIFYLHIFMYNVTIIIISAWGAQCVCQHCHYGSTRFVISKFYFRIKPNIKITFQINTFSSIYFINIIFPSTKGSVFVFWRTAVCILCAIMRFNFQYLCRNWIFQQALKIDQ